MRKNLVLTYSALKECFEKSSRLDSFLIHVVNTERFKSTVEILLKLCAITHCLSMYLAVPIIPRKHLLRCLSLCREPKHFRCKANSKACRLTGYRPRIHES